MDKHIFYHEIIKEADYFLIRMIRSSDEFSIKNISNKREDKYYVLDIQGKRKINLFLSHNRISLTVNDNRDEKEDIYVTSENVNYNEEITNFKRALKKIETLLKE